MLLLVRFSCLCCVCMVCEVCYLFFIVLLLLRWMKCEGNSVIILFSMCCMKCIVVGFGLYSVVLMF